MDIFSLQIEKHVIGGLINHPQVYVDIAEFLNEKDFHSNVHATIFCVIKDSVDKCEKIDKVLISQKIQNLGISFDDDINIFDYIESICFTQINASDVFKACQELVKIRIRRDLFETGEKIKKHAKVSGNSSIDEIISTADSIYSEKISSLIINDNINNLFDDIEKFVEERGNNQIEETGLITPYPLFNKMYGGLRDKNLYAFVARPGQGKSTLLSDICFNTSLLTKFKTKALLLDTEMETEDVKWRMISSLTGVPMWYLETGTWRNNADYVKLVRSALNVIKGYEFNHIKIGNKTVDQVCSIIRRWYYNKVGRGNPAIIAYDYIKLTGEKPSESWKEYQIIGEKIDKLKKLSEEINAPLLVATQLNRSGENHNRKATDVTDDSSAIAASDRLQWFASYVGIFRRKVIEEIAEDGIEFGTHKLITLKTRFQGRDAAGHIDLVKRKFKDGSEKYTSNYLNFNISNFKVTEIGNVQDIMTAQSHDLVKENDNSDDVDL